MPKLNRSTEHHAPGEISRREFLNLIGITVGALALPGSLSISARPGARWPTLETSKLPPEIRSLLESTPDTRLDEAGYLLVRDPADNRFSPVHLEPTLWNLENSAPKDRLKNGMKWGIVLHWFGDNSHNHLDLDGFMRGFNGFKRFEDFESRTSAHFLVGNVHPSANHIGEKISIVQTQKPDLDGHPFVAAHLRNISYQKFLEGKQYFLSAANNLSYDGRGFRSLLQTYYDGRRRDLNQYTFGIEITGSRYDDEGHFPSQQKVANVLSVVTAIMTRHLVPASHLLGHLEIQMNKPDPGKKLMALMRYLVGIQALVSEDELLRQLVFGEIYRQMHDKTAAVIQYFDYVRQYLLLTGAPSLVSDWEAISKYWFFWDQLNDNPHRFPLVGEYCYPIAGETVVNGYDYLDPPNHEGVDIHYPIRQRGFNTAGHAEVCLIANGRCLYRGEVKDCHHGRMAIFLHRQPDGAQFLSIYGHLSQFSDIAVGQDYPVGYRLGTIDNNGADCGNFLHFAIASGAVWDETLSRHPTIPLNGGPYWIKQRYFHPLEFLAQRIEKSSGAVQIN